MVELLSFEVKYSTKKGEDTVVIRAFNRPQAKRKLLSQVSTKHDNPVIKSITQVSKTG